MSKTKVNYPKSFKILRIIAWITLPLYLFRGCGQTFQCGCGVILSLKDLMLTTFGGLFIFVFITPLKRALLPIVQGNLKKKITMGIIWLTALTTIFLLVYFHQKNTSRKRLEWIFKSFIAEPIPKNVELIDGAFLGFQDKIGWLIFKTSDKTFQELANTYKPIPQDKIKKRGCFPRDAVNPVFYYRKTCGDDYCDSTFLIWDKDNLKCYVDIMPNTKLCLAGEDSDCYHSRWTEPTQQVIDDFIEKKRQLKTLAPEEILKDNSDTTLAEAVRMDNLELVKVLLRDNEHINTLKKETAILKKAVSNRNYEMAKLLIENGARISPQILHEAMLSTAYKKEIVKLLLDNGADVNCVIANYITSFDGSKDVAISATPLMLAVLDNNIELVKLLIEFGADLNATSKKAEYPLSSKSIEITALGIARKQGQVEIEKLLLEAGATQ